MTWDIVTRVAMVILAYISPIKEIFLVMLIFVLFDLFTGISASHKKGVPRSSRRARKSVVKLLCYLSAILLTYLAEKAFGIEWVATHKFIGAFICLVEMLSIFENLAVISDRPIFLKIIKLIRGKASEDSKLIKDILNEKNDTTDIDSNNDK